MSYFVYNLSGRCLQTWEDGVLIREVPIDQIHYEYCLDDMNLCDWGVVQRMGKLANQDKVYVRNNFHEGVWQTTEYLDVSSRTLHSLTKPVKGCLVIDGELIEEN